MFFSKQQLLALMCMAACLLQGCMALQVRQPLPENLLDQAQVDMNAEFNLAYNLARPGYKWSKYPPGDEPTPTQESILPEKETGMGLSSSK